MSLHAPPALVVARWRRRLSVRTLVAALLAGVASVPAGAQPLVGDGSLPCGSPHVVASGDTLSGLAARAYGDPLTYGFLADANWDAIGGDPENLAVGMEIVIPCVDASGAILTPEQAAAAAASLEAAVAAEGPLAPGQLDALLGPVALFPDQVLTLVLVAVTFPLDVVKAGRFVGESAALTDQDRAAQAGDQPWDDSVRELAAGFPALVTRMSENLDWTEQAGEAVVAQTDAVLDSVQRLRAKAQENGYLVDNDAQTVEEANDKIVIVPTNPNVVYVPTYDSQVVYTTPVAGPPVYHYGYDYDDDWDGWGDALVAGGIILGSAVILDEIFDDDWDGWDGDDDIDWDRGDITIDRGDIDIDIDRGDIELDRDDINIDRDGVTIGDGDRPVIGDGDRISIGDSDRTQVDRGQRLGDRAEPADRRAAAAAGAVSISNAASRDAARQKIESRKATGTQPAQLGAARRDAARPSNAGARAVATDRISTRAAPATRPSAARDPQVSRPSANRPPSARAPSRSNTFYKPQGGHRASAASNRGRSSMGGRGGGGRGGGGGRR